MQRQVTQKQFRQELLDEIKKNLGIGEAKDYLEVEKINEIENAPTEELQDLYREKVKAR